MYVGIYEHPFWCSDFGYCLRFFLAIRYLLRVIAYLLKVIAYFFSIIVYLLRVIVYFLRVIVLTCCMTHIIPTVEFGNIRNILFLKDLINLSFFLPPFWSSIVLDVHHSILTSFQIHITTCHALSHSSKWQIWSKVL